MAQGSKVETLTNIELTLVEQRESLLAQLYEVEDKLHQIWLEMDEMLREAEHDR